MHLSIASPSTRPSPLFRRVGIHIFTFEACSDFTHVTARWIAQPPKAAFVTRLRPSQSPSQAARQLPDQSTTLWVEPSSTGDTRLRGARNRKRTQAADAVTAREPDRQRPGRQDRRHTRPPPGLRRSRPQSGQAAGEPARRRPPRSWSRPKREPRRCPDRWPRATCVRSADRGRHAWPSAIPRPRKPSSRRCRSPR